MNNLDRWATPPQRGTLVIALVLALAATTPAAAQPAPSTGSNSTMRQPEVLRERTSGFWTSNRPTKYPYRWRLLAIGCGLVGVTGLLTWRLVRRVSRERVAGKT